MNPIGASSIAFLGLSGVIWGGWLIGSQSTTGQEALARAYANYVQTERAGENQDLFAPNALRALVCGVNTGARSGSGAKPCLAVAAASRMFIIDAGSGAAMSLEQHHVPLGKLESVLLTGADPVRSADLNELWVDYQAQGGAATLPVYGPAESHDVVRGINATLAAQKQTPGLQPWAPAPEPGKPVIVFEGDGLTVMAFTTEADAQTGRVGYRFDYRGRSLVVAGDGRAEWANATKDADVVLHGAQSEGFAQLHEDGNAASPFEVAAAARSAGAGMLVLTGGDESPVAQDLQVREAKQSGLADVIAGRVGMLLELPLANTEVNVRPL
jgi:ribonuclease Z